MDKNKNRTDLLAAGRKKLQQFRQKKDGKGSKSSSKAGKSERDSDADEASAAAKLAEGSLLIPDGEFRSVRDSDAGIVDSAVVSSGENSQGVDIDVATIDPLSLAVLPETGTIPITLASSVGSLPEGLGIEAATKELSVGKEQEFGSSIPHQVECTSIVVNTEGASLTSSGNSGSAVSEMASVHFTTPIPINSLVPADLGDDTKPLVISTEPERAHGLDQGADHMASEQVDRSSKIELEGIDRRDLPGSGESAEACAGMLSREKSMAKPAVEVDQTNELTDVSGATDEANEVLTVHSHSVSAQNLPNSCGSTAVNPEPAVPQSDVGGTSSSQVISEIRSAEWVGGGMQEEVFHTEGLLMSQARSSERVMEGKMVSLSSDAGVISVSLSELFEVLRKLDEDELRVLLRSRELAGNTEFGSLSTSTNSGFKSSCQSDVPDYPVPDVLERLKEHTYLANFAKDVFLLQLDEQSRLQMEVDSQRQQLLDQMSIANALLSEVRGRNDSLAEELAKCKSELQAAVCAKEEFEKQFHFAKSQVVEISSRADGVQVELERSHGELSSLSAEVVHCRSLMAALQIENDNLNKSLTLAVEEKEKIEEEKESLDLENGKLLMDLAECNYSLSSVQVENVNLSGSLALITEDRRKLEEVKENFTRENEKLLTDLAGCKGFLEALEVEKANLNESLTSVLEERNKLREEKDHFVSENEKLSIELADCKSFIASLQVEYDKAVSELKEATTLLEQLTNENIKLSSGVALNQVEGSDLPSGLPESAADETSRLHREGETELSPALLTKSNDGLVDMSPTEHSMGHLEEAEKLIQKLESTVESLHSHTISLSKSSAKTAAPAISRLIQAFESKGHHDDHDTEEVPSSDDELLVYPFMIMKEHVISLREVFKKLHLDAESAWELFKRERDGRIIADAALGELKVTYGALEEQNNCSEAANIELAVLYEFIGQHIRDIVVKKGELLGLYEAVMQQSIVLERENKELVTRLGDYQSRLSELERQLDEIHSSSDERASIIANQVESLHNEVTERASILEQEWNSTAAHIVQTVGKLDVLMASSSSSILSAGSINGQDMGSHVAASVDAATKVIRNLQEKLEASTKDHEAMCSSYKDMTEKFNVLHAKNELIVGVLRRIYDNLKKLVNDSSGCVEESKLVEQNENFLDPLHLDNYDTLMEQLAVFLSERLQLESVNKHLYSELIDKAKDLEELKKRGVDSDTILKLVEDVEGAIKLEGSGSSSDDLEHRICSLISFLFQKYKEDDEQASLSREATFSKEMELSELQGQIDHLSFLSVQHENEILVLKECLRQGAEDLVAVRAELQEKVNELEQSEQRVSSIREKLGIAVSKGKGLIVQRDNLKQSLAETSSELEKCSQELRMKDARLSEVEAKLKTYSEAGERVEALESELSYIRNSATALRESFLSKDSVLQRIEEILEDLELPEHFHSRDIIEKIDWLARSVTGNSLPLADWDQKSSAGGGSYSDAGYVSVDAWKEDTQPNSNLGDELRRKYEELQSKFYGLAEQNEMLEQSLMERNNVVQRWEEILERINMPAQLRSLEPEDRIEWLGSALTEAHHHCNSLQLKVDNFETYCATLTADVEDSQKRLSDLETTIQAVISEKEHLSESLEILTCDYEKVSEKAAQLGFENDKLQNEVTSSQERLLKEVRDQEHIEHVEGEIRRLKDWIIDVLQDSVTEDVVSSGSSIECLERLLQKLVEEYTTLSLQKPIGIDPLDAQKRGNADSIQDEKKGSEDQNVTVLRSQLEEALSDLMGIKEERDRYKENNQSLVSEAEALEVKRKSLQELLSQEEQKSASLREKLNVAVRKGKSLVQQRDSLKLTLEEVNQEVERLKSEIKYRDSSLSDYEQKIKELSSYQERVEVLVSESSFLRNQLAETEHSLQEKSHLLSLILNIMKDIDAGFELNVVDPVEKLDQIGKHCRDLHKAVASSEHALKKSKKAAELLVAELNEVQERNDELQEELAELLKEKKLVEAAKLEAFSRLEELSAVRSEEKKNQFSELMALKSCFDQLRKGFFEINDLLSGILSKDLECMHKLEAIMISGLEPSEALDVVGLPFGDAGSVNAAIKKYKEKFLPSNILLDLNMQERTDDNSFVEVCSLLGHQLQDFMKEVGLLKEELHNHSIILDEGAKHVSEVAGTFYKELTSHKQSFQSMKEKILRLESNEKEKDTESIVMRRNISLLYEACSSSVTEIENWKAEFIRDGVAAPDLGMNLKSPFFVEGGKLSRESLYSSEECIRTMADRLLSAVKDFTCIQADTVEDRLREMKISISNLQKELQEKDIQNDRICAELVSQIKSAEAAARSHLQDFQSAKAQLHDLESQVKMMEEERNMLELRVKELQDCEAMLKDLEGRVGSLNTTLAAKDQEIEALMQALDEEETQMEDLASKIGELERVLQQKNLDLENLEASRGKVIKKLSITVSKFDELHDLSASLLSEVEKLQSQLQERDAEISFLRQEVTRCTNDALVASQMSNKRNSDEIRDLLTWLNTVISGVQMHDVQFDNKETDQVNEYQEIFQKQIMSLLSELENLRAVAQSRDMLVQEERNRVEELTRKGESLESSLREKESLLNRFQGVGDTGRTGSTVSEIMETEPVINKRAVPGTSTAPQVRSLRKVNNDQVAVAIDMDPASGGTLEEEDDDKAHGFKSLTTSRIVPRFTRPVTDLIDGLWVSCDRALMRQPALRLGVIFYWALIHALLATFVV